MYLLKIGYEEVLQNGKGKPNQITVFTCISSFGFLKDKINIMYE